jgi:thymidylate kinase
MIIGLEGADGTGKSTLSNRLIKDLGYEYIHTGKPETQKDFDNLIYDLIKLSKSSEVYIVDRLPWISELIYSKVFNRIFMIDEEGINESKKLNQIIIYCSIPVTESADISKSYKSYKSHEFLEEVKSNSIKIRNEYKKLFESNKIVGYNVISYDFTIPNSYDIIINKLKGEIKKCVDF